MRFGSAMTKQLAKRLLDLRREGAPMTPRVLRDALRASGDLRSEWGNTDQRGPQREHDPEHPRMNEEPKS
jgi:hypothetical protein